VGWGGDKKRWGDFGGRRGRLYNKMREGRGCLQIKPLVERKPKASFRPRRRRREKKRKGGRKDTRLGSTDVKSVRVKKVSGVK